MAEAIASAFASARVAASACARCNELAVSLSQALAILAQHGVIHFAGEGDVPPSGLTLDQRSGALSGDARSLTLQPYPLTIIARDTDGCELARYTLTVVVEGEDVAQK